MRVPDLSGTQLQSPVADPRNPSSLDSRVHLAVALISPLSRQLQQQDEEIDEVEIESERAHQRLLGEYVTGVALDIDLLDPLRVPGGQAGKNKHTDHRNGELQRARGEEDIDQARQHDTNQAHQQKGPDLREVASRRITVEACRSSGPFC